MKFVDGTQSGAKQPCFLPRQPVAPENTNARRPDSFIADLTGLRRPLYQRALFLCQDQTAAEDLLQETMEKALNARHRFEPGSNIGAWAFSIMRNLFIDGRRRRAAQARLEQKASWLLGGGAPPAGSPRVADGATDDAGASIDPGTVEASAGEEVPCGPLDIVALEDVNAVVATLAPAQQQIFALAYIEHLTYRQIAGRLGIPVSTTGTRLLRVRAKVRTRLERIFEERWRDFAAGHPARS